MGIRKQSKAHEFHTCPSMQQASMFVEHSVFKCRQTDVFENFNWILRISVKEGNHKLGMQSTKPPGVRNHILKLHFHLWRLLPSPPGQHSSGYNGTRSSNGEITVPPSLVRDSRWTRYLYTISCSKDPISGFAEPF